MADADTIWRHTRGTTLTVTAEALASGEPKSDAGADTWWFCISDPALDYLPVIEVQSPHAQITVTVSDDLAQAVWECPAESTRIATLPQEQYWLEAHLLTAAGKRYPLGAGVLRMKGSAADG
ncbi:MAG: hypothetical protein IT340_19940 [Chloroflexi bacterium]|nr:hypothetical protein [Chloroflexota bacterium]